jgi:HK97 family phage major capsid protein
MEWAALFGDGSVPNDGTSTGQQPIGIRNTPGIHLVTFAPERLPTLEDLEIAVGALEDANVEETETWSWVAAPRTFRRFTYKKDTNGLPILRNSWADGPERTLVDYAYHKTTAISVKQGGGSASTLFFGDWAELLFGMGLDVELLVSAERLIDKNQTFVMGVAYVDTAVGYPEAFSVTEGVL